jgi:hypothetical protein
VKRDLVRDGDAAKHLVVALAYLLLDLAKTGGVVLLLGLRLQRVRSLVTSSPGWVPPYGTLAQPFGFSTRA